MKKLIFACLALVLTNCGTQESVESGSRLAALYAESSIGSLGFGVEGNKVYLVEGAQALSWAHAAPTKQGNKIRFRGKDIGNVQTGYLCNGPFDDVCDASIYKSRPSSITIKNLQNKNRAPKDASKLEIFNANTKNLGGFKVSTPVNGKAKGSCSVKSNKGTKTIAITVEQKKAKDANNQEVTMLEVKTPIYKYNQQKKALEFVEMKTLQKVFGNGAVQNVQGKAQAKSMEHQGLLRLFQ